MNNIANCISHWDWGPNKNPKFQWHWALWGFVVIRLYNAARISCPSNHGPYFASPTIILFFKYLFWVFKKPVHIKISKCPKNSILFQRILQAYKYFVFIEKVD